jgi:energy-coupling factor transport system permease protein
MLKDITIGQYYAAPSKIHSLDPRTKIIWLILYMVLVFSAKTPLEYLFIVLLTVFFVALSKVPFSFIVRGLKPVAFLVCFTAVINLFMTRGGDEIFSFGFLKVTENGLSLAVSMLLRIILLVVGSSLLTLTTSPTVLTGGLEKLMEPLSHLKFPSHEIAMMMSIALRFIPTLVDEAEKIMKAQISRGGEFESGNPIKKAKAMLPLLVPLFVSAFRRADELAMAMETRCYRGGVGRTSYKILKYKKCDVAAFLLGAISIAVIVLLRIFCS